eukprot:EG_transcript_14379
MSPRGTLSFTVVLLLLGGLPEQCAAGLPYPIGSCTPTQVAPSASRKQVCKRRTTGRVTFRDRHGLCMCLISLLNGIHLTAATGMCFFIEEKYSSLRGGRESFFYQYFESPGSWVLSAKPKKRQAEVPAHFNPGEKLVEMMYPYGKDLLLKPVQNPLLPIDGIGRQSKTSIMMKYIRLREEIGAKVCQDYAALNLSANFVALSFRRGDKWIEGVVPIPVKTYIQFAIDRGVLDALKPAVVFVATDDYEVIPEYRALRPNDTVVHVTPPKERGFNLKDVAKTNPAVRHQHYMKFFVELHAMANAKYFIGTWRSNVCHVAYYIRWRHSPDTFFFIDSITPRSEQMVIETAIQEVAHLNRQLNASSHATSNQRVQDDNETSGMPQNDIAL